VPVVQVDVRGEQIGKRISVRAPLTGDGGLAMLLGELVTLRQQRLPVKIVVFNNGALSFVELEMKAAGIVNYGTGLDNPDFAAVARATGLFDVRVDKAGDLPDALREAFGHDGPARDQDDPVRRGEELVELTKSNLRELEVE
jgi:pyruvate dehydrogenase (quinone)